MFVQTFLKQNVANRLFSMQKVTLKFKSVSLLWEFKQAIKAHEVEINLHKCTITCHCSGVEVSLAVQKFGAEVVTESHQQ